MRITTKIVGVAAAAALVAGGALAAAPAQAAGKVAGSTGITVPLALIGAAQAAGVAIAPIAPATASVTTESVVVGFPVSAPTEDGILPHTGGISLTSAAMALTLTDPQIAYATSPGTTTAQITGVVGGIPSDNPFASANGARLPVFDVASFTIKNRTGKVVKSGDRWKRTDRQTMTGLVKVVDNATIVNTINGLLGVALFTPGMDFGTLSTSWTRTLSCKTKKACSA